ncbi:MAG: ABC transporter ATP-binding protein [Firmicutes bacterium]|nr:ABC transporter ATP-binding protein [Bacillota bacterium]
MSFDVHAGEIFGFPGPSGAGKSTLQKILTGILKGRSGSVTVMGHEAKEPGAGFLEDIGVVFGFPTLYAKLTAMESLRFFSSLYKREGLDIMPLLERTGLSGSAHKRVSSFSKGMKTRLAFVRALLHSPVLLFLDEPTSGFDPANARIIKDMILEQKWAGRIVILTTHNMHDAHELCDRVAFIVDGKIRALDTPQALCARESGVQVSYAYLDNGQTMTGSANLSGLGQDEEFMKRLKDGTQVSRHSKEPSLEGVFVELTGRCLA